MLLGFGQKYIFFDVHTGDDPKWIKQEGIEVPWGYIILGNLSWIIFLFNPLTYKIISVLMSSNDG